MTATQEEPTPPSDWVQYPAARLLQPRTHKVQAVGFHFTASGRARALARWIAGETILNGKRVEPARHFAPLLIARTGLVYQQAPLTHVAFHTRGRLRDIPSAPANDVAVGVENANWGFLQRDSNGTFFSTRIDGTRMLPGVRLGLTESDVVWAAGHDGVERWWERFTPEQIETNVSVLRFLASAFPEITPESCFRHSDLDPSRKWDPGPAFPLAEIVTRAFSPAVVINLGAKPPADDESDEEIAQLVERRTRDLPKKCRLFRNTT